MKYLLLFLTLIGSSSYAQEWVAYQPYPPVIEINQIPSQTFSTYIVQQPRIVYQWVPYYVNQSVLVEQRHLFCRKYHWTVQPTVQWVQQPIIYQ